MSPCRSNRRSSRAGGAVGNLRQQPYRHVDPRPEGKIEANAFPLHDGVGVIVLREFGDRKLTIQVEYGHLGQSTAKGKAGAK